jgi:hypothetical protein
LRSQRGTPDARPGRDFFRERLAAGSMEGQGMAEHADFSLRHMITVLVSAFAS